MSIFLASSWTNIIHGLYGVNCSGSSIAVKETHANYVTITILNNETIAYNTNVEYFYDICMTVMGFSVIK